jgi:hypothetical protein
MRVKEAMQRLVKATLTAHRPRSDRQHCCGRGDEGCSHTPEPFLGVSGSHIFGHARAFIVLISRVLCGLSAVEGAAAAVELRRTSPEEGTARYA